MEITFTQQRSYSLTLMPKQMKELADKLNLTLSELKALVKSGDLYDEHGDELTTYVNGMVDKAEVTEHEDVEIDEINL